MLPDTSGVIGPDARRGSVINTQKNNTFYLSAAVKSSLSEYFGKKQTNNNNINIIL